ncbi:MAG: hypothetical protein IJM51_03590 [Clostridia bacterium]|nr:hypothetical protein [Clostridia bacterium]
MRSAELASECERGVQGTGSLPGVWGRATSGAVGQRPTRERSDRAGQAKNTIKVGRIPTQYQPKARRARGIYTRSGDYRKKPHTVIRPAPTGDIVKLR